MNVEYMLARRTARHDRGSRSAAMMRIASASAALGMAVMIVTLAVVSGFRHEVYGDLRGFAADIRVFDVSGLARAEPAPIASSGVFLERLRSCEGVVSAAPFAFLGGMAKNGDEAVGLGLKGVGGDYDLSWWSAHLVEGGMPLVGGAGRTKEILVSQATASALDMGVGDKVEMLFVDGGDAPRRDRFVVSGIYRTGFEEMDRSLALTDIRNVRRAAGWDDATVSGYDVMLERGADADAAAVAVESAIERAFYEEGDATVGSCTAATLAARYPVEFDWLATHDMNARVILAVMAAVVLFNMASAILIMVMDRTGMIGVLKAAGMRNGAVRRIFLYRAAMLFLRGAAWGNAAGLGLAAVQAWLHPVRLDPSGYMLSEVPVRVEAGWWLLLNAGALAVTLAAMLLPSAAVARITPEESLKYKQ